jgi:asparagine synthase (glutamine-hydrolysing)
MCGIAGWVGAGHSPPHSAAVLDALRHRGPDMQCAEEWSGAHSGGELFFTRLAIVDLSECGSQPMSTEDGRLTMVFNGEIYNSPELRRECQEAGHRFRSSMDGEVILHLWETWGPDALSRLNGIFAVAIVDRLTDEVFLARDPLGVKPLVYACNADGLWFASELRALLAAGAPAGGEDTVALAQLLSFLWIPAPRTPYKGIASLEPGCVLRWAPGGLRTRRYCLPLHPVEKPERVSAAVAVRELEHQLLNAVRRQLLSDVPIGIMASGGVDSSLIWWAAGDGVRQAFTIDWTGDRGDEHLSEDALTVRTLAERLNTPVAYLSGQYVDDQRSLSGDLFADPAHALTGVIAGAASEAGYKVLFSGQGGDELFAGYRRHQIASLLNRPALQGTARVAERLIGRHTGRGIPAEYAARTLRALAERDPFASYMQLCTYSTASERARVLGCTEGEVSNRAVWRRHREIFESLPSRTSYLRKVMTLDLNVYLPGLGLAYVDRAAMEHGVEVRVPWLDLELVRWSLTLPDNLLLRRGRGKLLPKLLTAERVSPLVALRAKRGFGAPAERVARGRQPGERGFRQGRYFALAADLVRRHRSEQNG